MAENDETEEEEIDPELAAMMVEHGVSKRPAPGATGTTPGEKPEAPVWALPENRFARIHMEKRAAARRHMATAARKQFIKPENALVVARRLPEEGGQTHCILRGDFVLADLLPYLLEEHRCPHMRIATLTMSVENAVLLKKLVTTGKVGKLTLVLSHYFEAVNKSTVFAEIEESLEGMAEIVTMRSHAKVICCPRTKPSGEADWLVLEGSANLRSSDNLEQMTIFNDREVHDFHAEWIDHVVANPPATHRKKPRNPETPESR